MSSRNKVGLDKVLNQDISVLEDRRKCWTHKTGTGGKDGGGRYQEAGREEGLVGNRCTTRGYQEGNNDPAGRN